eukprot:m.6089 g.6089  ORF g.6089 m.6089 type:complete len:357 (-) comp2544_c0_seq1:419-1489(-)
MPLRFPFFIYIFFLIFSRSFDYAISQAMAVFVGNMVVWFWVLFAAVSYAITVHGTDLRSQPAIQADTDGNLLLTSSNDNSSSILFDGVKLLEEISVLKSELSKQTVEQSTLISMLEMEASMLKIEHTHQSTLIAQLNTNSLSQQRQTDADTSTFYSELSQQQSMQIEQSALISHLQSKLSPTLGNGTMSSSGGFDSTQTFASQGTFQVVVSSTAPSTILVEVGGAGGGGAVSSTAGGTGGNSVVNIDGTTILRATGGIGATGIYPGAHGSGVFGNVNLIGLGSNGGRSSVGNDGGNGGYGARWVSFAENETKTLSIFVGKAGSKPSYNPPNAVLDSVDGFALIHYNSKVVNVVVSP